MCALNSPKWLINTLQRTQYISVQCETWEGKVCHCSGMDATVLFTFVIAYQKHSSVCCAAED